MWQELTDEQTEQAEAFALSHAPDPKHWSLYHPVYRAVWRRLLGYGWLAWCAARPLAKIPGIHDKPKPIDLAWVAAGLPPERDTLPEEPPDPKPLKPRGAYQRARAAQ